MGIVTGTVVFVITWVIIFLMVLPWGIRHSAFVPKGSDPGAPENPHLQIKLYVTTILAICAWICIDMYVG